MNPLAFDVETTFFQKGNPFSQRNKLVLSGLYNPETGVEFNTNPCFNGAMLIGFNIKFDLHWYQRYYKYPFKGKVWDVQLAHFMLTGQKNPYPSLNDVSNHYGHGEKLDYIKLNYWDKGIDTDQIPIDELKEYLQQDLILTWKCYESQLAEFREQPLLYRLFQLHCADLQVLQQIEWSGLLLNEALCNERSKELTQKITLIEQQLKAIYPEVPLDLNSVDHLSCFIYGGVITVDERVEVGVYKSGAKIGKPRFKINQVQYTLPRLANPPKGSELKKEGYFSTDDKTLSQLRGTKRLHEILGLLKQYRELSKVNNTYYKGLVELRKEMDWYEDEEGHSELHGQFNQCVVPTGRLSSTRPNQQNLIEAISDVFYSRMP